MRLAIGAMVSDLELSILETLAVEERGFDDFRGVGEGGRHRDPVIVLTKARAWCLNA